MAPLSSLVGEQTAASKVDALSDDGCAGAFEVADVRSQRAVERRRQLKAKREEYRRACSAAPPTTAPAPAVKPHRMARASARALLARGLVEHAADMPSIVSTGRCAPGRQKQTIAAVVNFAASGEDAAWCSDEETAASEADATLAVELAQEAAAEPEQEPEEPEVEAEWELLPADGNDDVDMPQWRVLA